MTMTGCNYKIESLNAVEPEHRIPAHQTTSLAMEYLDSLLLRIQPGTDNWYRNHFPIVFETNKSHYFGYDICNQMNVSEFTFPVIEYGVAVEGGGMPPQPFETKDK